MKLRLIALGLFVATTPLHAASVVTLPTSDVAAISSSGMIAGQALDMNGNSWAAVGSGSSWKALKVSGFDSTTANCTYGSWTGGGASSYATFTQVPVIWDANGTPTVISMMDGEVTGIGADKAAVTLYDMNYNPWPYEYVISQKKLVQLAVPSGFSGGWTAGVSETGPGMIAGTVVGTNTTQAILWNGGLQPKPIGAFASGVESQGVAVNGGAQFVGTYFKPDGTGGSFYWDSLNGMRGLAWTGGYVEMESLNASGAVVGTYWRNNGTQTAIVYSVARGLMMLPQTDATYNIVDARSINDSGVIVGRAYKTDGIFAHPVTVERLP